MFNWRLPSAWRSGQESFVEELNRNCKKRIVIEIEQTGSGATDFVYFVTTEEFENGKKPEIEDKAISYEDYMRILEFLRSRK